jgi:GT2 family glycosyltransferase
MKNNISLLVGLKNNLDYNKHFYQTTRELYPDVEICFVSYGSTDGTHEWLNSLNDKNVNYFYSAEQKTFSDTFNKAAEIAKKDYVAYLHNDIVLAPGFLENLEKHVSENNVVSYTTIEPPIFAGHERPGKLIYDLGVELETFDKHKLYEYVESIQDKYSDKTEPGITFFMCMPRKQLLEIGGMDNLYNPMFCEDDDLIRRWKLLGMNCFTALDAICYHFVSKTSRFSDEYQNKTQQIEFNSNRNFIRKWGNRNSAPKYNIAFVVRNCNLQVLELLEPWCDRIYVEQTVSNIIGEYTNKEQSNTKFDLTKRVLTWELNDPQGETDIIVEIDVHRLTNQDFAYIQQLAEIIADSAETCTFEIGNLLINIYSTETYEKNLIHL